MRSPNPSGLADRLFSAFPRWLGAALLFEVAAVVQTWPLARHLSDGMVTQLGWELDGWRSHWNLWWVKKALVDLHTNPYHTDFLFYPGGSDLYLHTLAAAQGALSIPLQMATGNLFLSWNLLALTFFALSGLGMFALAHRVTGNHAAALVAGYAFAFSPYIMMKFQASHWEISTTWPIPFFLLFILRFHETRRWWNLIAAAVFWAVLSYNNIEFAVDAGMFMALFLIFWSVVYVWRGEREQLVPLWGGAAVLGCVWFVLSSWVIIGGLFSFYGGEAISLPSNDEFWSMDVTSFVTPSPLWGSGIEPKAVPPGVHHVPVGNSENTVYLGFVPMILAGLALLTARRHPRRVLFWLGVFLMFAILALGPHFYVGDTKEFTLFGVSFSIPLPYQLYDKLPIVNGRRIPTRMVVFGLAGFSVLVAIGFDSVWSWLRSRQSLLGPLAALIVLGIVVLEYWNPPVYLIEPPTPAVFAQIAEEPGDFTVLHAPWGRVTGWTQTGDFWGGYMANYYQTIHERRTFGGWLSRASDEDLAWVSSEPGLRYLTCPGCPDSMDDRDRNPELVRNVFRKYRIKYVTLHRLDIMGRSIPITEDTLKATDSYLRNVAGLTLVHSEPSFDMYLNPEIQ